MKQNLSRIYRSNGAKNNPSWFEITLEKLFLLHLLQIIFTGKKTYKGRETRSTNSIIIQQEYVTEHTNQSNVALIPDIVS